MRTVFSFQCFIVHRVGLFLTAGGRNESAANDVDDDDLRV